MAVDRAKTCPFLVRVFPRPREHHPADLFVIGGDVPTGEVQIYTWEDATLKELAQLLRGHVKGMRKLKHVRLSFKHVYPSRKGENVLKDIGEVDSEIRQKDDRKTLKHCNFEIGDFLSVAYTELP